METTTKNTIITVRTLINAPVEKVWKFWTDPNHIIQWNYASDDWHTPRAENDLRTGGKFLLRMEAKDKSIGFDFKGEYTLIKKFKEIAYTTGDGRKVQVTFVPNRNETKVTETFEAELVNPLEMQQLGWKAILNNFKTYVESRVNFELMHFEIDINTGISKVYQTMLDAGKWSEWTSVFNPTSHFKGTWESGSKILFLGTGQDGKPGGMVSRIRENIPDRFVSIEHLGIFRNGKEFTSGPETEGWSGAMENYTLTRKNGKTLLAVDMDTKQEFKSYFRRMWPKALNKLKTICEEAQ